MSGERAYDACTRGAARHLQTRVAMGLSRGAEELGKFLANFALTYSNLTAQANFSEIFARCARRQIC